MNLTMNPNQTKIISTASQYADWIGVQEYNGVSRSHAVFLRSKSQFIFLLDWVRLSSEGLVPLFQYANLTQSGTIIGVMWSGLKNSLQRCQS